MAVAPAVVAWSWAMAQAALRVADALAGFGFVLALMSTAPPL